MDINEIKEYLETNKESQDVIDFMKSIQKPLNREMVEQWTKDGDGRSWLDRTCDLYSTKAIETARNNAIAKFKEEELPKIIEQNIKENSNDGLTPEQIEIKELKAQMEAMKAEKEANELLNTNRSKLKEAKLSEDLAKYIKEDSDIEFFKTLITESVNNGVKDKINNSSYTPPSDSNLGGGKITWEQVIENPTLMVEYQKQNNN